MRIQDINTNLKNVVENDTPKKKVTKNHKSETSDKVEFSDTIHETKKLIIDILDYPENRAEKVKKLKNMIKSGQYNVDVHKLADKIVEDLLFGNFYK